MNEQIESIKRLLSNYSGFEIKSTEHSMTVYPDDEDGFLVSLIIEPKELIVQWGPCHHHFFFDSIGDEDEAINLFWFGLTNLSRIRAYSRGKIEYQWIFEFKENKSWEIVDNTKVIFSKFWKPKVEKIYQNNIIDSSLLNGEES